MLAPMLNFMPSVQGESIQLASVEKLQLQYTYDDGENFCFMDTTTFEEVTIAKDIVGDKADFMLEGNTIESLKWGVRLGCKLCIVACLYPSGIGVLPWSSSSSAAPRIG
jgi:hypothetical protein